MDEDGMAAPTEIWGLPTAITRVLPQCTLIVDRLDECAASKVNDMISNNRFPSENDRARFLAKL